MLESHRGESSGRVCESSVVPASTLGQGSVVPARTPNAFGAAGPASPVFLRPHCYRCKSSNSAKIFPCAVNAGSLPPRERAGVRGNGRCELNCAPFLRALVAAPPRYEIDHLVAFRLARSSLPREIDFLKCFRQVLSDLPGGIMMLQLAQIGDITDVIALFNRSSSLAREDCCCF